MIGIEEYIYYIVRSFKVLEVCNKKSLDMQIGWMFYTSKWFNFPLFIRILDPTLTSEGNKIKNNQTIYIRRVQVETKTS